MGRKKKLPEGLNVVFEAIVGRQGGRGIFGIEDEAGEAARQTKLQRMKGGSLACVRPTRRRSVVIEHGGGEYLPSESEHCPSR
jgi:hypothetical protein